MISLLIKIKHQVPAIWRATENVNGFLTALRYKGLESTSQKILDKRIMEGFSFSLMRPDDIPEIINLHQRQQPEYIKNFNPHPFDRRTLLAMAGNKAYILMKVSEEASGEVVGYFFIRSFFVGKAFHGLLTDEKFAGRGIGSAMWRLSMEICRSMGLRMFATMSQDNIASYKSARNGTRVNILNRLENNFIFIECCPKETTD